MTTVRGLSLTLLLVLALTSYAGAAVVAIQSEAPLSDHSDESIQSAVQGALEISTLAAMAMGLTWVRLDRVLLFSDSVMVRVLATDHDVLADEDEATVLPIEDARRDSL